MPYKDPERNRECIRKWKAENREYHLSQMQRWREANPDRVRELNRRYRESAPGIERNLRFKGAPDHDAHELAKAVCDPYSRCAICGVPARMLALYKRKHMPVPSSQGSRWRLEVDRVAPGGQYVLSNCRLLCPKCNTSRGAARKTDAQVLAGQRKRWQKTFPITHLWWLRKFIGDEARPFRGTKHAREAEDEVPVCS